MNAQEANQLPDMARKKTPPKRRVIDPRARELHDSEALERKRRREEQKQRKIVCGVCRDKFVESNETETCNRCSMPICDNCEPVSCDPVMIQGFRICNNFIGDCCTSISLMCAECSLCDICGEHQSHFTDMSGSCPVHGDKVCKKCALYCEKCSAFGCRRCAEYQEGEDLSEPKEFRTRCCLGYFCEDCYEEIKCADCGALSCAEHCDCPEESQSDSESSGSVEIVGATIVAA